MKDPVRITIDFQKNSYTFEYAVQREPGLTPDEHHEADALDKELREKNFSDFAKAELLKNVERDALMAKKHRLEELRTMEMEGRFEFVPVKDLPRSLFVLIRPEQPIECVSNMADWMLNKLFERTANISITQVEAADTSPPYTPPAQPQYTPPQYTMSSPQYQPPPQQQQSNTGGLLVPPRELFAGSTPNEQKVMTVLWMNTGNTQWEQIPNSEPISNVFDLITVKEENGIVYIRPKRFLKNNWAPINSVMKAQYGERSWISHGKGDKDAHWEVNFR